MRPFDQPMPHGNAVIKDKTVAFPSAVFRRRFFEVTQDSTFQVVNVLNTLTQQKVG